MVNQKPDLSELNRERLVEVLLARVSTLEKRVARLEKGDGKAIKQRSQNA